MNAQHSNKSCHHYTPLEWINRAIATMGSIDTDPCTDYNAVYKAQRSCYAQGETQPWNGNVFCNPPGTRGLPRKFFDRCCAHALDGNQVIYLAYSIEQLVWIQDFGIEMEICIPRKRIAFLNKKGDPQGSPTHGNAFIYLGNFDGATRFRRNFPGLHLTNYS